MDSYLEAIKQRVCNHCIERSDDGDCRIGNDRLCTIETNYDRIVKAILSTHSDRYEDYVAALRENVCESCSYGAPEECDDRNEVECPLDRYYPMVVDAIEDIGIANIRLAYARA